MTTTNLLPTTTIGTGDRARTVSRIALGAMHFGTRTDETTSFAILDAYVEAGGSLIDTANNYAYWVHGTRGGESESLLGRWLRDRGVGDEITVATKVGGRPIDAATAFATREVQDAAGIREAAERSLERLGRDRIDLYYSHVPDSRVPLEEQVEAFGALVSDGLVSMLGASNYWPWTVERARRLAADRGLAAFEVLQYLHSYFRGRTDPPDRWGDGQNGIADGNVLSFVRSDPALRLVAYSPLLGGAYTRSDKPFDPLFEHPGTTERRAALAEVAAESGASAGQVVLAWLLREQTPTIPLVGASSVGQLRESLAAASLELTEDQLRRLNAAGV